MDSLTGGHYIIGAVALIVGLLTLFSMLKIFIYVFWGEQKHSEAQANIKVGSLLLPIVPLVLLTIVLGFAAEPMFTFSLQVADQLLTPSTYIDAVLGE